MEDHELQHYGVLGMKWGIRRGNVDKAYSKASNKLNKIDKKFNKRLETFHKKAQKAETSGVLMRDISTDKARKAGRKLTKIGVKGKKWVKAMEKNFKGTSVSLSEDQINRGKKYTDYLTSRYNSRY